MPPAPIPPVPATRPTVTPIWITQIAHALNLALNGKLNAVANVTLTPSATSTTLADSRIGAFSFIALSPLSAAAAAALAGGIYFEPTTGSVVIRHPSAVAVDQNFAVLIIG